MEEGCKYCHNIYHTSDEHEIFKEYFKKSVPDLVSIIISLEQQVDKLGGVTDSGCAHSASSSSSPSANSIPSNGPSDSPFKSSKEPVTVSFQRGAGARPMSNKHIDKNKPIEKMTVLKKDVFINNGEQYYRMICGHGDYIDLLVDK